MRGGGGKKFWSGVAKSFWGNWLAKNILGASKYFGRMANILWVVKKIEGSKGRQNISEGRGGEKIGGGKK